MTILRILNLLVWGGMGVYMFTGAWAAMRGVAVRRGDPMRLACFATAFVFVAFNLFWLFGPTSQRLAPALAEDITYNSLLVLSAALGAYIWKLGITYGRGPLIDRETPDA